MGLSVEIKYQRGWNAEMSFTETLSSSFEKDSLKDTKSEWGRKVV